MISGANCLGVIALAASLGVLACRARGSVDPVSIVTERRDAAAADVRINSGTTPDAASDASDAATSDCVLDIGGGRKGSRTKIGPDGVLSIIHPQPSCWLEADCIREHGRDHPGDAMVSIQCRGRRCACAFESFTPRPRNIKFSFDAEDPCDDARLKSLLLDRCVSEGRRRATQERR
jgi:hypothetical protein